MEWVFIMNRMSLHSSSVTQQRRMALGVVILLLVDVIWVASSELTSVSAQALSLLQLQSQVVLLIENMGSVQSHGQWLIYFLMFSTFFPWNVVFAQKCFHLSQSKTKRLHCAIFLSQIFKSTEILGTVELKKNNVMTRALKLILLGASLIRPP